MQTIPIYAHKKRISEEKDEKTIDCGRVERNF